MDDPVTLPAYADQVRELIRHDRNDEAIAICKHILSFHPKYIDAYRQMGEAYLEHGDLDNAKDLFRRVLSADPENVVAYTGLSMVFSNQQLIDEAIWHLERAYELAPGNVELQKELLQLYNEVDAKSHSRLKLTSAALGRIYAQEGLFAHAIQEFRSIIASTPSRLDIRVALAETLWRMGHLSEAAQVAQSILAQLPYCLKANLILGMAWKETGLPESELHLKRAQSLDPMGMIATRWLGPRSSYTPAKPSVPRYVEGAPSAPAKTETTLPPELASLDKDIEQGMTGIIAGTEPVSETFQAPPTEASVERTSLTDFLAQPSSFSETTVKPDITPTVLPPWLQTKFPNAEPTESTLTETPSAETTAEEMPSWLSRLQQVAGQPSAEGPGMVEETSVLEAPAAEPAQPTDALPAWLSDQPILESTKLTEEALPPWISDQPIAESPKVTEEQLPAWMTAVTDAGSTQATAPSIEPVKAEPAQELPGWRAAEATSELTKPIEEAQLPVLAEEPVKAEPVEELPAWIAAEATAEPAKQIEEAKPLAQITEPIKMEHAEAMPSWIAAETVPEPTKPIEEAQLVEPAAELVKAEPVEELPVWIAPQVAAEPTKLVKETKPVDELPAWIQGAEKTVEQVAPVIEEKIHPVDTSAETESLREEPAPTAPTVAESVPSIAVELPSVPAPRPAPRVRRQPKFYPQLQLAREYRTAERIDEALKQYNYLVQHAPRMVNQVIDDLEILIQKRWGVPLEAHRILGDAYSRANRLAEALEQYRFVLDHTPSQK